VGVNIGEKLPLAGENVFENGSGWMIGRVLFFVNAEWFC